MGGWGGSKWKEIREQFYSFFLCPSPGRMAVFFKHIKFEILMIYREMKSETEGERGRGGGRGV